MNMQNPWILLKYPSRVYEAHESRTAKNLVITRIDGRKLPLLRSEPRSLSRLSMLGAHCAMGLNI